MLGWCSHTSILTSSQHNQQERRLGCDVTREVQKTEKCPSQSPSSGCNQTPSGQDPGLPMRRSPRSSSATRARSPSSRTNTDLEDQFGLTPKSLNRLREESADLRSLALETRGAHCNTRAAHPYFTHAADSHTALRHQLSRCSLPTLLLALRSEPCYLLPHCSRSEHYGCRQLEKWLIPE